MSTQPDPFNDVALKSALKRACGGETAPALLRQQLQALLAQPEFDAPRPPAALAPLRLTWWQRPAFRLAAAVLLVALMGMAYQFMNSRARHIIRRDALLSLVADHDRCCDHTDSAAPQNVHSVAQTIRQRLNHPVLAPDLATDGWKFRSAAICRVDGKDGAHLVFARGMQRLSVYSVPAFDNDNKPSALCCDQISGHLMAGIVRDGELYCIVAHCPGGALREEEIRGLLERHLSDSLIVAARLPSLGVQ